MVLSFGPELLVIVIAIIVLFGASKIPELARSLGKATGEFQKAKHETERELKEIEKSIEEDRSSKESSSKIRQMAKDMGITTEGKSDEELLDEIKEKMPSVKSDT